MTAQVRRLICADGTITVLPRAHTIREITQLIQAEDSGLDTVSLRNGLVMCVDDLGHSKNLPVNNVATTLYHGVCKPGTTHEIRGDVVVTFDADFGD